MAAQGRWDPARLVFLDEAGAKTNMTRLRGRSLRGTRCHDEAPDGHWKHHDHDQPGPRRRDHLLHDH